MKEWRAAGPRVGAELVPSADDEGGAGGVDGRAGELLLLRDGVCEVLRPEGWLGSGVMGKD